MPHPVLIAEMLSPSTATRGRSAKLADYRRQPRRAGPGRRLRDTSGEVWPVRDLIGEAELRLEVIDAAIPLAAIYEGTAV